MALSFSGSYSPAVSLALTWSEQFQLFQDDAQTQPQPIAGLYVRAQLRADAPVLDGDTPDPVLEITSPGYYDVLPDYAIEGFTIDDANLGKFSMELLRSQYVDLVSPTNEKKKYKWEIVLVDKDTGDAEPVVRGAVIFLPAVTL